MVCACGAMNKGWGRRTLEKDLEDTPGLLVDEARDTLDTATARQTADRRLGDALDVVTQDLQGEVGEPEGQPELPTM